MTTTEQINEAILAHDAVKKELAVIKAKELELRKEVLKLTFNYESDDREGTENIELGEGWKLKAVFKLTRKLGDKEEVDKALTKIEKSGPEGALVAERLVNWEPKLNKKEYDILPPKFKKLFDEVLTIKPGLPSVSLVPPKGK